MKNESEQATEPRKPKLPRQFDKVPIVVPRYVANWLYYMQLRLDAEEFRRDTAGVADFDDNLRALAGKGEVNEAYTVIWSRDEDIKVGPPVLEWASNFREAMQACDHLHSTGQGSDIIAGLAEQILQDARKQLTYSPLFDQLPEHVESPLRSRDALNLMTLITEVGATL